MEASALQSFIEYGSEHHFPLENIPFGVFHKEETLRCCTRIGDSVIDLAVLDEAGVFDGTGLGEKVFHEPTLNKYMSLGRPVWKEVRAKIQEAFSKDSTLAEDVRANCMHAHDSVKMGMPAKIGDYTDFYSSKNHAYNVGCMFRGPDNAFQPNYFHLPVGYHGRASSIVLDGTPIRRPRGQVSADKVNPTWSTCNRLDIELEMGAYVGVPNELGDPIKMADAMDHLFGMCILNDWSARDIQVWEYVPLGPFGAKNFASTISPWIVTFEALAPFKVDLDKQDPEPMDYLRNGDNQLKNYAVELDVFLKTENMSEEKHLSKSNMKYLYWSVEQQLVHHALTGCNMQTGDMFGSGTISGTEKSEYGSLLEITWAGKEPIELEDGDSRVFLKDGDSVRMTGSCKGDGYTIGFGDCTGTILPAHGDDKYF